MGLWGLACNPGGPAAGLVPLELAIRIWDAFLLAGQVNVHLLFCGPPSFGNAFPPAHPCPFPVRSLSVRVSSMSANGEQAERRSRTLSRSRFTEAFQLGSG